MGRKKQIIEKKEEPIEIENNDDFLKEFENKEIEEEKIDDNDLILNEFIDNDENFLTEFENKSVDNNGEMELIFDNKKNENVKINDASNILNKIINDRNKPEKSGKSEKIEPKEKPIKSETKNEDIGGSEILGKERRELLDKIHKYKALFPEKLKNFRLGKKLTKEYLESVILEFEAIIESDNVDNFITDGFLICLKQIEGTTANYKKYNISGMSDMLKANPQFHKVMKQLYLKYNVFNSVPPEHQLMMIIFTTSYICMDKNKRKAEIDSYLNEPFNEPFIETTI